MRAAPFDGRRYLIDTSAAARAAHPSIRQPRTDALVAGQLLVSPPFLLEVLYSARNASELHELEEEWGSVPALPVPSSCWRIAQEAMRRLAPVNWIAPRGTLESRGS